MPNYIAIADELPLLADDITASRVFIETLNDKLNYMVGLFDDAELRLHKAEARCQELKKLLEDELD